MDFSLDEETILLRNSAEQYLRENCPTSFVKKVVKEEMGFSRTMWKEMADLGWLGLIYDERYGGVGGKFFDLFILFEEIGKVLLPSPFFVSAVLSGLIINEAGDVRQKDEYLTPIIKGEKIFTIGLHDEQGRYDFENPDLEARETKDGDYILKGTRILVPYAHVADAILVVVQVTDSDAGGPTILKVDTRADGHEVAPLDVFTEEKTFTVVYEDVEVPSGNVIGAIGEGDIYLNKIFPKATILKCGEMLGGLERVFGMTVAYVKERHQFGQPLGSLQVVQHYCADMATFLETTRLIAYQAASLLSEDLPCGKEVSMAKAWCSDAYKKCTWIGHQLHGGIGFTEEHDLHLYYKHAKASELSFEDSWFHRSKVAEEMGL